MPAQRVVAVGTRPFNATVVFVSFSSCNLPSLTTGADAMQPVLIFGHGNGEVIALVWSLLRRLWP